MIPPFFIGSQVEVIGQPKGNVFEPVGKIGIVRKTEFYADGDSGFCVDGCWYPANSLRLVEEGLKIGDYVEAIGPNIFGGGCGKIFEIEYSWPEERRFAGEGYWYPASHLRKLAPEEVARHLKSQCKATFSCDSSNAVAAIEKTQLKLWQLQVDERLSAIEKLQFSQQDAIVHFKNRLDKMQKSIDVLERIQRGEGPETILIGGSGPDHYAGSKDDCQFISIAILGNHHYTNVFKCPEDAMRWCKVVLDSMREG